VIYLRAPSRERAKAMLAADHQVTFYR